MEQIIIHDTRDFETGFSIIPYWVNRFYCFVENDGGSTFTISVYGNTIEHIGANPNEIFLFSINTKMTSEDSKKYQQGNDEDYECAVEAEIKTVVLNYMKKCIRNGFDIDIKLVEENLDRRTI